MSDALLLDLKTKLKVYCNNTNDYIAYATCKTLAAAATLLIYLNELGYTWESGNALSDYTYYDHYKDETCYFINCNTKTVQYCKKTIVKQPVIDFDKMMRLHSQMDDTPLTMDEVFEYCRNHTNCDDVNGNACDKCDCVLPWMDLCNFADSYNDKDKIIATLTAMIRKE